MKRPNKEEWINAMEKEIASLRKNETWNFDLPAGEKTVNTKWVFALKNNKHGEIERYTTRIVSKGCSPRFGIDYGDTFSPVFRYSTIHLVFALAVHWEMDLHQIDITSAHLNSEIHHDLYLRQPEMFEEEMSPRKVLQFNKGTYGLKQSGKEWYDNLTSLLTLDLNNASMSLASTKATRIITGCW